jgi:hypothetical protein
MHSLSSIGLQPTSTYQVPPLQLPSVGVPHSVGHEQLASTSHVDPLGGASAGQPLSGHGGAGSLVHGIAELQNA